MWYKTRRNGNERSNQGRESSNNLDVNLLDTIGRGMIEEPLSDVTMTTQIPDISFNGHCFTQTHWNDRKNIFLKEPAQHAAAENLVDLDAAVEIKILGPFLNGNRDAIRRQRHRRQRRQWRQWRQRRYQRGRRNPDLEAFHRRHREEQPPLKKNSMSGLIVDRWWLCPPAFWMLMPKQKLFMEHFSLSLSLSLSSA